MNLSGAIALVTGGARRVGRAIAFELAERGCDIGLHHHESVGEAEALAAEIRGLSRRCELIRADLAAPAVWPNIIDRCAKSLGSLDILVNNASIFETMDIADFDLEKWDRTFRVNVTAAAALSRYAGDHLGRNGCGKVVNITDISAQKPWSRHVAYCASKSALTNLTLALAKSMAPHVQVNGVAPGIAIFPESYGDDHKSRLVDKVPLERAGTPEDIARVVRFLCEDGDYITGQIVAVDGGRLLEW